MNARIQSQSAFYVPFTFTDDLEVWATYYPGYPGNREEPAEARGWIVETVLWRGIDITNVLEASERDRIAEEINCADEGEPYAAE